MIENKKFKCSGHEYPNCWQCGHPVIYHQLILGCGKLGCYCGRQTSIQSKEKT